MSIIKYFLSFPFNPKNEVEFLKTDMEGMNDFKDQALTLFFVFSGIILAGSYATSWLNPDQTFSIYNLFIQYVYMSVSLLAVTVALQVVGKDVVFSPIDNYKLFCLVIIGTGLCHFVFNLLFSLVYAQLYSVLLIWMLDIVEVGVKALLLFFALSATKEFVLSNNSLSENSSVYFRIFAAIFVVRFVVNFVLDFVFHFGGYFGAY